LLMNTVQEVIVFRSILTSSNGLTNFISKQIQIIKNKLIN
jgi:hypothetical protein